jgi:hypothetical protein
MRAQVMAIQVLLVNLLALSLSPLTVAALSDEVFGDSRAVGYALAITVGAGALAAVVGFASSRRGFVDHRVRAGISS